jgi:hypothetical protein
LRRFLNTKMYQITSTLFVLLIATLTKGLVLTPNDGNLNQNDKLTRIPACQNWYNGEGDPQVHLDKTLKPPCKISPKFPRTLTQGWSVDDGCDAAKQPDTCGLHVGAYGCYRHSFASTGPGAQACYDQQGNWIADPWQGAGTLDAETPLGGLIQALRHYIADVKPYYDCCRTNPVQTPYCNLYFEKRPPGVCEGEDLSE